MNQFKSKKKLKIQIDNMGNCFGMPNIGNNSYVPMNDLSESLLENSQYGNNLAFRLQMAEKKIASLTSQLEKLHQNMRIEATRNSDKNTEVQKALEQVRADHCILLENDKFLIKACGVLDKLENKPLEKEQENKSHLPAVNNYKTLNESTL